MMVKPTDGVSGTVPTTMIHNENAKLCLVQVNKVVPQTLSCRLRLTLVASQAAVQRSGNKEDQFQQDIAVLVRS